MYPKVYSSGNTPHLIPKGIKNITELTLELFDNNYHLYAQKINHSEDGLFIRVILMKKKKKKKIQLYLQNQWHI